MKIRKIAILYTRLSGYTLACLRELKRQYNVELLVFAQKPASSAPFDFGKFEGIDRFYFREDHSRERIGTILKDFNPDAIYVSGWAVRDYLKAARPFKKRGVPVIAGSDTQWKGTLRHKLAALTAPYYLHPYIDILWASGDRQIQFAKKIGYTRNKCWYGFYSCDWEKFSSLYPKRVFTDKGSFLYVGRYLGFKGIDILLEAYSRYRKRTPDPWPLYCAGAGPLQDKIKSTEGVIDLGFVQPNELPSLMLHNSVFVLPSRSEPWGVVIHEAVSTGMPVVCSDICGAAVHLVQDGYNGYIFETGNAAHLADSLRKIGDLTVDQREKMGRSGFELSKQFTPSRWADTFINGLYEFHRNGDVVL